MARPPVIDKPTLLRYVRMGLTHQQMADLFLEETGEHRSRTTFIEAMKRHKVDNPRARAKYAKYTPWPGRHKFYGYELRMLWAYAALMEGDQNKDIDNGRLKAWMKMMDEENLVVMFHAEKGFFRVPREDGDEGYITVKNWPELNKPS